MSTEAIRPFFSKAVLSGAVGIERTAKPEDAGNTACSHKTAIRKASRAGDDTSPHFAFFHRCKPYLIKQFPTEAAALAFADRQGYEFDGKVESGFLKAYADD